MCQTSFGIIDIACSYYLNILQVAYNLDYFYKFTTILEHVLSYPQPKNPLHGITLEVVVTKLEQHYSWQGLADRVSVKCFQSNPSVKSSLKFLRKTAWARKEVEELYVMTFCNQNPWKQK